MDNEDAILKEVKKAMAEFEKSRPIKKKEIPKAPKPKKSIFKKRE